MLSAFGKNLEDIVGRAGKMISKEGLTYNVYEKPGTANYVTDADRAVQDFLIKELSALVKGAHFVCEENEYSRNSIEKGTTFIIDPIDGTSNFLFGMNFSAVSVGAAEDGVLQAGAVYNPFTDEMFCAERGRGSFLNGKKISLKDMPLEKGLLATDTSPYNPELRDKSFALQKALSYHAMDIRNLGSAALSICFAACGRCAAYYSFRLYAWDYAAAQIILTEAGGKACTLKGESAALAKTTTYLAGAPSAVEEILKEAEKLI